MVGGTGRNVGNNTSNSVLRFGSSRKQSPISKVPSLNTPTITLKVREVPLVLQGRWVPKETPEYKEKREIPEVKEHLE